METNALIGGNQNPNVFRVKRKGVIHAEFSTEYPEALRGIMSEDEYVAYLKQIDRECNYSTKVTYLMIISLVLLAAIAVLYFVMEEEVVFKLSMCVWVFISAILGSIVATAQRR